MSEEARHRLGVDQEVLISQGKIEVLLMITADQQMLLCFVEGTTLLLFDWCKVHLPLGVLGLLLFRDYLVTSLVVIDVSLGNI